MDFNASHQHEPPAVNGLYPQPPYTYNRVPTNAAGGSTHANIASQWTSTRGYDSQSYGPWSNFTVPPPGVEPVSENCISGFRAYGLPDNPDYSRPPPGHVSDPVPYAPHNTYDQRGIPSFQSFQQHSRFDPPNAQYQFNNHAPPQQQQHMYQDFSTGRYPPSCPPVLQQVENHDQRTQTTAPAEDEATIQKRKDQQWIRDFLQRRTRPPKSPQTKPQPSCAPELRETLNGAARLLAQLRESCDTLQSNTDDESEWLDSFATASRLKSELEDKLKLLESLDSRVSAVSSAAAKRKARRLRAKQHHDMDRREREQRHLEAEAAIDAWRLQKIRQVEDRKREQELKLAADAVLCEVRKKQSDVKRMQDILRSLEKLRKLRKEAASRKCIVTELECEEAFYGRLEKLRNVLKSRTTVYASEERALMVMLEGEQEEERMREREKQVKNEMDKWLQKKQSVDAMLFGDGFATTPVLQAFTDYYSQAQHSLHTLLQIRKEWDMFVVAAAHPEGSPVPQDWVEPELPSDHLWASSLHTPAQCT